MSPQEILHSRMGRKKTTSFETNLYSSKELTPLERRKF
jgi:hypothetical protein